MKCVWCGKDFDCLIVRRKKYCSTECAKKAQHQKIKNCIKIKHAKIGDILQCRGCGKKFIYTGKQRTYCSGECEYIAKSTDKRKGHTQSKQICWTCKNACGGCSWSSELKPVKGWKAKPTNIKCEDGRTARSYKITFCPEYIPDDD